MAGRIRSTNPATLWSSDGIHRQGSLDGLCGIYSAVNATSLLLDGKLDSTELFASVVRKLGRRMPRIILNGLDPATLENLVLQSCATYLAEYHEIKFSYRIVSAETLAEYWQTMQDHYEEHGKGSILLSMSGIYEHWTCVRNIKPRCIMLADSSQLNRLYRSKVTIGEPNKQRIHQLLPSETFLLSIE